MYWPLFPLPLSPTPPFLLNLRPPGPHGTVATFGRVMGNVSSLLFAVVRGAPRASISPLPVRELEFSCCYFSATLVRLGKGVSCAAPNKSPQVIFSFEGVQRLWGEGAW